MYKIATIIGLYAYVIFLLGIQGLLYKENIFISSAGFIFAIYLLGGYRVNRNILRIKNRGAFDIFLTMILISQIAINLVGVLGPEISFDALWYHLTLPKIYLQEHRIFHIPGGLLYYSDMPKLTEMLYIPALALIGETGAKLLHFIFGILSIVVTYKISRHFLSERLSLLSAAIFYSNLVVGWESITAYVDLARTFYESLALLGFLLWLKTKKIFWFLTSALMLGFAVSVKLLSLSSLLIFIPLVIFYSGKRSFYLMPLLILITLFIPSPWFLFSHFHTGNPVYPFFTQIYPIYASGNLNPLQFLHDISRLFIYSSDPLSPLYIVFLPFVFVLLKTYTRHEKILVLYSFLALMVWYIIPKTGGGRFILPYLPILSVFTVITINKITSKQNYAFIFFLVMSSVLFSIIYRGAANAKFIPVLLGYETKSNFLGNHLNFSYGDFYDIDGFFKKNIKSNERVLLYGFHNLYYVEFPFIDSSWVKSGDIFNYIAVQNTILPQRFSSWEKIHHNKKTHVTVYTKEKKLWAY